MDKKFHWWMILQPLTQRSHEQLLEAILDCTAVVVDVVAPAECLDMLYIKMIPIG